MHALLCADASRTGIKRYSRAQYKYKCQTGNQGCQDCGADTISWASVYLVPVGDTTITHFALSDEIGNVLLKEVPVGRYEVNAEMIGYTPHKKEYGVQAHWKAYDLGIIRLEENAEYIDAASISAVGNPIIVKKDSIEFNAAAFTVGENAMLEDLLKNMSGMEVGADGSV